jgi:hypothetical protein
VIQRTQLIKLTDLKRGQIGEVFSYKVQLI